MKPISYVRQQFPTSVIQQAARLYLRFTLSYRDVEELLAERGLQVGYETVRRWVLKFGPEIDRRLRRQRRETCCDSGLIGLGASSRDDAHEGIWSPGRGIGGTMVGRCFMPWACHRVLAATVCLATTSSMHETVLGRLANWPVAEGAGRYVTLSRLV